jgi:ferredoxin
MKTNIYYFSGTGNSRFVATEIGNSINDSRVIDIASLKNQFNIKIDAERIGIVFPCYFYGLPLIVEEFIQNIQLPHCMYFFAVVSAMYPNGIALGQLKSKLLKKGVNLNWATYLQMPNNYIISLKSPSDDRTISIVNKAKKRLKAFSTQINNKKQKRFLESSLYNKLMKSKSKYKKWHDEVRSLDKNFLVNNNCNNCGLCQKICPASNISMVYEKPIWHNKCELCLKCLHSCPKESIDYGDDTKGKRRYKFSSISLNR